MQFSHRFMSTVQEPATWSAHTMVFTKKNEMPGLKVVEIETENAAMYAAGMQRCARATLVVDAADTAC